MTSLQPTDYIAHRPPFLFVDELSEVAPGVSARGSWKLTGEEWFFSGHFPGRPTLPGVLIVESIAQLGAVALLADSRYAGKLPLFGGIEKCRFRRQVLPGDTMELQIEMSSLSARGGRGAGSASVNGELACRAELLFIVVDG